MDDLWLTLMLGGIQKNIEWILPLNRPTPEAMSSINDHNGALRRTPAPQQGEDTETTEQRGGTWLRDDGEAENTRGFGKLPGVMATGEIPDSIEVAIQ